MKKKILALFLVLCMVLSVLSFAQIVISASDTKTFDELIGNHITNGLVTPSNSLNFDTAAEFAALGGFNSTTMSTEGDVLTLPATTSETSVNKKFNGFPVGSALHYKIDGFIGNNSKNDTSKPGIIMYYDNAYVLMLPFNDVSGKPSLRGATADGWKGITDGKIDTTQPFEILVKRISATENEVWAKQTAVTGDDYMKLATVNGISSANGNTLWIKSGNDQGIKFDYIKLYYNNQAAVVNALKAYMTAQNYNNVKYYRKACGITDTTWAAFDALQNKAVVYGMDTSSITSVEEFGVAFTAAVIAQRDAEDPLERDTFENIIGKKISTGVASTPVLYDTTEQFNLLTLPSGVTTTDGILTMPTADTDMSISTTGFTVGSAVHYKLNGTTGANTKNDGNKPAIVLYWKDSATVNGYFMLAYKDVSGTPQLFGGGVNLTEGKIDTTKPYEVMVKRTETLTLDVWAKESDSIDERYIKLGTITGREITHKNGLDIKSGHGQGLVFDYIKVYYNNEAAVVNALKVYMTTKNFNNIKYYKNACGISDEIWAKFNALENKDAVYEMDTSSITTVEEFGLAFTTAVEAQVYGSGFYDIGEILSAGMEILPGMNYEFGTSSAADDTLSVLAQPDEWTGTVSYTADGVVFQPNGGKTCFVIDGEESIFEENVVTVLKVQLPDDEAKLCVSYGGASGKIETQISADKLVSGGSADVTTNFDIGNNTTEVLFIPDDTGYKIFVRNESTDNMWLFAQKVIGYKSGEPFGDIAIIGDETADGAVLKSVKSYKIYDGEDGVNGIKNIVLGLGANATQRNLTWFSKSSSTGVVTWQKRSEMVNGAFTSSAKTATATRDAYSYTFTGTHYNNKAVITDLEQNTEYCYQLSNGTDKTEIIPFKTGNGTDNFSFAFVGDVQIGSGTIINTVEQQVGVGWNGWGRTLNQIANDSAFSDVEFIMSAGDQINSLYDYEHDNLMYDGYFDHPELKSIASIQALGNHDNYTDGGHYIHFNEPNMDRNYGISANYANNFDGADYYFIYNSMLCVVLNLNSFNEAPASLGTPSWDAKHKAAAENHIAFIEKVMEETKDNKDIKWKIILQHQSPYGGSYHNNYTQDPNHPSGYARPEVWLNNNVKKYLFPAYYENGFDLVLSGHDHTYTRTHILKPIKDASGNYVSEADISPYANTSGENYYTYADGTTTPTYVDWTDLNGVTYKNLKVSSVPVKVTNPDGLLHVTGSSSSGASCIDNTAPNHYAAVSLGHNEEIEELGFDAGIARQAIKIDVTATSLTITNYGMGGVYSDVNPSENILDTFTIEKSETSVTATPSLVKSGDNFSGTVQFDNNLENDETKDIMVVMALYGENDKLLYAPTIATVTLTKDYKEPYTLPAVASASDVKYAKLFVWEKTSSDLIPLCNFAQCSD